MSLNKGIKLTSVKWEGQKISSMVRNELVRTVDDTAEFVLGEANRTVPHREGILQASGDTDVDSANMRATIFYDTPYARRLHEHPEYRFNKGRRGKWLELTLIENIDRIRKFSVDRLSRFFK